MLKHLILVCVIAWTYTEACYEVPKPIYSEETLSVPDAFKKYNIVDNYIPEAPQDLLSGGHSGNEIKLGAVLSPLATITPVHLSYENGKEEVKYTVVLVDIDAVQPSEGAYINAMFVNAPAKDLTKGDIVVPYSPAVPLPNSGTSRFVGLLYQQKERLDADSVDMLKLARNRSGFSAKDFAKQYGLGKPVAGNFFLSSWTSCES